MTRTNYTEITKVKNKIINHLQYYEYQ